MITAGDIELTRTSELINGISVTRITARIKRQENIWFTPHFDQLNKDLLLTAGEKLRSAMSHQIYGEIFEEYLAMKRRIVVNGGQLDPLNWDLVFGKMDRLMDATQL